MGGWFVQTLESGTQYRACHEGLGAKRQLVLFRRPAGGNLEHVTAVAVDDLVSVEKAAIADDTKRTTAAATRCGDRVVRLGVRLDEAKTACDLVRDDLKRLQELTPQTKRAKAAQVPATAAKPAKPAKPAAKSRMH